MSKVTMLWFTHPDKPFKVFSFRKIFVYFFLFGFFLLLTLCITLFVITKGYLSDMQSMQRKIQAVQEKNAKKSHQIEELQQEITSKMASIRDLKDKLIEANDQLHNIRKMENKIRSYLGLSPARIEDQTHQGGFGLEEGDSGSIADSVQNSTPASNVESIKCPALNQKLGELLDCLEQKQKEINATPSILPVSGEDVWLSCGYGWRTNPFTSRKEFHPAIDVAGRLKTPVIAPANGKVIEVGSSRLWGKFIRIRHNHQFLTEYGHLHSVEVSEGDRVSRRDVIGYMGNSGRSTGTHLHYKVVKDKKHVNPWKYILDRTSHTLALRDRYAQER